MISKFKKLAKELGVVDSVFYSIDRIIRKLTFNKCYLIRYLLVAQPVSKELMLSPKRGANIIIREIDSQDPVVSAFPVPKNVIEKRFHQNARCLVAEKNDEFVGYIWLAYEQYHEDEVRATFSLPADGKCVWDFDVYIEPKYRIGFAFMKLWDEAYTLLRKQGVTWTYSRISAFNPQSKKSHNSLGAKTLCYGNFLIFGNFQIALIGCKPYLNFSIKTTPTVQLPHR